MPPVHLPPLEQGPDATPVLCAVAAHDLARDECRQEEIAEEVPVALVVNGISQAVMMATPQDLEDFAVGFALTEGLVGDAAELLDVDVERAPQGLSLQLRVTAACEARLKRQRRRLAGRTGCGLCGTESLEQLALGKAPAVQPLAADLSALSSAMAGLRQGQVLNARCGGLHAAAWCDPDGRVRLLREDVGRHNALDKVIGAHLRGGEHGPGFVVVSSRASAELVHKAVVAGAGLLASVSAPTALAVELARAHALTLVSFVREGRATRYA